MLKAMKPRRKHTLRALGIIVVLAVVSATILASLPARPTARDQTASAPSPPPTDENNPVQLRLPNAAPITALIEDYTHPSSQWVVVNKTHPLSIEQYVPKDLMQPLIPTNTSKSTEEQSIRKTIVPAAIQLFTDAKSAGYELMIASGFRSYQLQKTYFDNYVRTSGEAAANTYSARPGQSEHQTGIAFDVSLVSRQCYLETCFGDTQAGKWLAAHAHEYGFILRYPADKTSSTDYQYEPWHFRYVGTALAAALHEHHLTLDEAYPALQTSLQELRSRHLVN